MNGGGAWSWTATEEFIRDFCDYCEKNPRTSLRFVQMGLRQAENVDHKETEAAIKAMLGQHSRLVEERFVIVEPWDDASALLPNALCGFDYGFSASKNTIEAYTAHRVRVTEYMQYSLPMIINDFDALAPTLGRGGLKVDVSQGFHDLFSAIERETEADYKARVDAVQQAVSALNAKGDSGRLVDAVENVIRSNTRARRVALAQTGLAAAMDEASLGAGASQEAKGLSADKARVKWPRLLKPIQNLFGVARRRREWRRGVTAQLNVLRAEHAQLQKILRAEHVQLNNKVNEIISILSGER